MAVTPRKMTNAGSSVRFVKELQTAVAALQNAAPGAQTANGTQAVFVAQVPTNLGNSATGTQIATAVNANAAALNAILTALIAFKIMAAS